MRVSFTDQWQVLFDENGKPLIGRVKFMEADASQFKHIYYEDEHGDETLAPNPCYTLQDGRLEHQIFLDYGAYTCIVEKFNGEDVSSMTDYADDDSYWTELKRFKVYGGEEKNPSSGDIDSGFVDTIADLRLVDPTEHSVVSVIGYYTREDGIDPRTYVWEEENDDAEDYGSTIVSSVQGFINAGRWKLCEKPILAATTFGVFPYGTSSASASDLSIKATALAAFANGSSVCSKVAFESGRYYFAPGTRLSFLKEVITGCTSSIQNTIRFDMDGIQDLVEGETLDGTVEIAFLGGLVTPQTIPIIENGDYITIAFGAGTFRTNWVKSRLSRHIDYSHTAIGVHCIIDDDSAGNFCSTDNQFNNWTFDGTSTTLRRIPDGTIFNKCTFIGKCFGEVGDDCKFLYCGTIYQEQLFGNTIKDNSIWNLDGSVKSVGTKFVVKRLVVIQTYTDYIDNSCIESENGLITSTAGDTFKFLDRNFKLQGEIGFVNSDKVYASDYVSFEDCVMYAAKNGKKIDLCGGSFSISLDVAEIGESKLHFMNGTLSLGRTGTKVYRSILELEYVDVTFTSYLTPLTIIARHSEINGIYSLSSNDPYYLYTDDCIVQRSIDTLVYFGNCECVNTDFIGQINLVPYSNELSQNFIGCSFDKQIVFNTSNSVTTCNVKIVDCNFGISNSGTPIEAIGTNIVGAGSFADDDANGYVIENNKTLGDAFIRPTKRTVIPIADVSYSNTLGFFEDKLFHIGDLKRFRVSSKTGVNAQYYRGSTLSLGTETDYLVNDNDDYRMFVIVEKL